MIRPLNPETDAEGVVEIIHETFPITTTTVESWRQQHAAMPSRARHAGWVAIIDGVVAARGEGVVKGFPTAAPPSPASACVARSDDEGSAGACGSTSSATSTTFDRRM